MPRKRNPDVIVGHRAPEHFMPQENDEGIQPVDVRTSNGEAVFQSRYRNLAVQLACEPDKIFDGHRIPGRTLVARFDQYVLTTDNPEMIERLRKSKQFGVGKDFWDVEDLRAHQQAERLRAIDAQLEDPEVLRIVEQRLAARQAKTLKQAAPAADFDLQASASAG